MSEDLNPSVQSIINATESRAKFSGHGTALGAAGYREESDHPENCEFLSEPGSYVVFNPQKSGFESILIGAAWDNLKVENAGFFGKLFKKVRQEGIDLDVGCMYELQNGERGAIQAFGKKFGNFDNPPYLELSGDERTGDADGHDECILLNGKHWNEIKRVLIYIYIYEGAPKWSMIKPQVVVDIPGENDLYVTLKTHDDSLSLCAIGELENVRGGIKLTNRTEYFPGHQEMDRAFGFGLNWGDGKKE